MKRLIVLWMVMALTGCYRDDGGNEARAIINDVKCSEVAQRLFLHINGFFDIPFDIPLSGVDQYIADLEVARARNGFSEKEAKFSNLEKRAFSASIRHSDLKNINEKDARHEAIKKVAYAHCISELR